MNRSLLILFAGVFLVSCKKDPLPELPEENDPYYCIRGLVNGDSINWIAGLDNVTYNYGTGNLNGIETYYGVINSGINDMAIKIEIVEPELIYDGATIASIEAGKLSYLVNQNGYIKFNFGMNYEQFNYVLVKNEQSDFTFQEQVLIEDYGVHNLTLKFTDFSNYESYVLPVRYGFEFIQLNPYFNSISEGSTLIVTPETQSGTHEWFLNGNFVSDSLIFAKDLDDGIYQLKHKLKDDNGNVSEHTTLIRMKDGTYYWQLKYFYMPPSNPVSHYGNVIISMRKDGVWYTSKNATVNCNNDFTVSNVETIMDVQFKPVSTLFDFEFGAMLYNDDQSDSLYLPQMVGSLSVGLQ